MRDAVSIAALCEVAEEAAFPGDLDELRAQLVALRIAEAPDGIEEAEDAARELQHVLGAPPHVASPGPARRDRAGRASARAGARPDGAVAVLDGDAERRRGRRLALERRRGRVPGHASSNLGAWKEADSSRSGATRRRSCAGLRDFAEQQAEGVKEAQREQFATLTLSTAVDLTQAALAQVQPTGTSDEQAIAAPRRDARAVPRGGRARLGGPPGLHARVAWLSAGEGFGREAGRCRDRRGAVRIPPSRRNDVRLFDRAVVRVLPAVPRSVVRRVAAPLHRGADARGRAPRRRRGERRGHAGDGRRARRGGHEAGGGRGHRGGLPRRARRDRERRARRERLGQADRARAQGGHAASAGRSPSRSLRDAGGPRHLRPDRHGGLEHDGRHARALPVARAPTATTAWASCSRPRCAGRSTTSRRSPRSGRACGSARASTSSRRRSRSTSSR